MNTINNNNITKIDKEIFLEIGNSGTGEKERENNLKPISKLNVLICSRIERKK